MSKLYLFRLSCIISFFIVSSVSAMSNPASEKCIADGGRSYTTADSTGNQYGLCAFTEGTICDEREYYHGTCVRIIKEHDTYKDYTISFPLIGVSSIDKPILQYIGEQIKKTDLMLSTYSQTTSGVKRTDLTLSIDCKPVTATMYYYSVICFNYNEGGSGNHFEYIETFNFDRSTNKQLGIHSLFKQGKLKLLSRNLYRYFVLQLQVVENNTKKLLIQGLDHTQKTSYLGEKRYPSNYKDFTIYSSGALIDRITLYFEPHHIAPLTTSQWVKVAYPTAKIIR